MASIIGRNDGRTSRRTADSGQLIAGITSAGMRMGNGLAMWFHDMLVRVTHVPYHIATVSRPLGSCMKMKLEPELAAYRPSMVMRSEALQRSHAVETLGLYHPGDLHFRPNAKEARVHLLGRLPRSRTRSVLVRFMISGGPTIPGIDCQNVSVHGARLVCGQTGRRSGGE